VTGKELHGRSNQIIVQVHVYYQVFISTNNTEKYHWKIYYELWLLIWVIRHNQWYPNT